jgi:2-oxoisovalerate dehydrogenase E1 component alpha subunit
MDELRERYTAELAEAARRVRTEPHPAPGSVWDHVFADENLVGGGR